ncbi:MAG TPA: hypothetical protein DCL38_00700 [Lachnospiraceae bacterium]|nr:hypothetical protein [Lachnospiraceae bacterium]
MIRPAENVVSKMVKNILNEFQKGLRSKGSRLYILGILVLCVLANTAVVAFRTVYGSNEGTFVYNILTYATWCFYIPYYTCIIISDIVFGREYPSRENNACLKEGLNPVSAYLVKLFASILLAFVFMLVTIVVFFSVTELFHMSEGSSMLSEILDFLEKMLFAIPLWLAGIGMGNMFLFMFDKKPRAYAAYFLVTVVLERGIMLLAAEPFKLKLFRFLRTFTVTQQFSLIPYPADPARNIPLTVFLGFFYLILSTCAGIYCFSRRIGKPD